MAPGLFQGLQPQRAPRRPQPLQGHGRPVLEAAYSRPQGERGRVHRHGTVLDAEADRQAVGESCLRILITHLGVEELKCDGYFPPSIEDELLDDGLGVPGLRIHVGDAQYCEHWDAASDPSERTQQHRQLRGQGDVPRPQEEHHHVEFTPSISQKQQQTRGQKFEGEDLETDHWGLLPQTLETGCEKCTANHKQQSERVIRFLIARRPRDWKLLANKYDPKGEYERRFAPPGTPNTRA
ncbi:hypothetical protein FOCC_FOCC001139 [Frankliniella occidentalis]|nr:hypothetical protein FOCC_FOCC001139 [Frankliniella occidentalis]